MKNIAFNKKAVSNVLGYFISLMIISIVTVSAITITMSIKDTKSTEMAEWQAQTVANKVADSLVDAIAVLESNPETNYSKTLDIPLDLADFNYYIEITNSAVYVNTTNGRVSKQCTNFNARDIEIDLDGIIYSGSGKIVITANPRSYDYKLDWGKGDIYSHSPIESGYFLVGNSSAYDPSLRDPPWWNYKYRHRIPILINNTVPSDISKNYGLSSQDFVEYPMKIVISPDDFNYNFANVTSISSSKVYSDLVFHDPGNYIVDADLYVDDNAPPGGDGSLSTPFQRIQDAVNVSSPGDIIFVFNGIYRTMGDYKIWSDRPDRKCNVHIEENETDVPLHGLTLIGESKEGVIVENTFSDRWNCCFSLLNVRNVSIISFTCRFNGPDGSPVGISLWYSSNCFISNCDVSNMIGSDGYGDGFFFALDSNNNTITNCDIHDNARGIQFKDRVNNNIVTNCNIYNNSINGLATRLHEDEVCSYNKIFHNNFYCNADCGCYNPPGCENSYNALDNFENTWDNGYPSGGNYWDDYRGTDANNDGIGDIPYNISNNIGIVNNWDNYPLMKRYPISTRHYCFDYLNPEGESIILLNLNMLKNSRKYVYLYYGYDGELSSEEHLHHSRDISYFFEDFNDLTTLENNWHLSQPSIKFNISNDCLTLYPNQNITTKNVIFSPNETHVVDAKIKMNNIDGNIHIFQQKYGSNYFPVLIVSANHSKTSETNNFMIHTCNPPSYNPIELQNTIVPILDHWLRIKSYVINSMNKSEINNSSSLIGYVYNYLYRYDTYTYEGFLRKEKSFSFEPDEKPVSVWHPVLNLGISCGLIEQIASYDDKNNIIVDWIRVMKSTVGYEPTISIGPQESINYGWTPSIPKESKYVNSVVTDAFHPGPVLRDFINTSDGDQFYIGNLTAGQYIVTVIVGDANNPTEQTAMTINSGSTITLPATESGQFETIKTYMDIEQDNGGLNILFTGGPKPIAAIIVEDKAQGGIQISS